jgi:hypothetical protein
MSYCKTTMLQIAPILSLLMISTPVWAQASVWKWLEPNKVKKNPDGSFFYEVPNKPPCRLSPYYFNNERREKPLELGIEVLKLSPKVGYKDFSESDWKKLETSSPSLEAIYLAREQACTQFANGEISQGERDRRNILYARLESIALEEFSSKNRESIKKVLVMDSPVNVYDRDVVPRGGTNADEITKILRNSKAFLPTEKTSSEWERVDQVLLAAPDVILIHLSAFESLDPKDRAKCNVWSMTSDGRPEDECIRRLVYFLKEVFQKTSAKVIIYSRQDDLCGSVKRQLFKYLDSDGQYAGQHVVLFDMKIRGKSFKNQKTVFDLRATVEALLGIGNLKIINPKDGICYMTGK